MSLLRLLEIKKLNFLIVPFLLFWNGLLLAENKPNTLNDTLSSLLQFHNSLNKEIAAEKKLLKKSVSLVEKAELEQRIKKLETELRSIDQNIASVIAGTDISALISKQKQEFSFQNELFELLKPALDEMKAMTVDIRKKTQLRKGILQYQEQLPVIEKALNNLAQLIERTDDKTNLKTLKKIESGWKKKYSLIQTELQTAQLQLNKMLAEEMSLADASQSYFKSFFRQRGLYLLEAIMVVISIGLIARLGYLVMKRIFPGFTRIHRSFRIRLIELLYYFSTIILMILGPMLVFYLVEDWVLFSLGILLLIGLVLTLRHAIPRYIHQIELFLNIGSVREGERILLDGLPWKVDSINVYCSLNNPDAGLSQRVHIDDLVDQKSRRLLQDEPWFPCKKGEWVILNNNIRGQVTGLSIEMVELTERGGATVTYQMGDFLAASPRNLSKGFRLKELIGLSYDKQADTTQTIPDILVDYIKKRLIDESYEDVLRSLKVEFAQSNSSSLDLVVIADFDGEVAALYGRLRRAMQRFCVDACTQYEWEIPYPQMTIHKSL